VQKEVAKSMCNRKRQLREREEKEAEPVCKECRASAKGSV